MAKNYYKIFNILCLNRMGQFGSLDRFFRSADTPFWLLMVLDWLWLLSSFTEFNAWINNRMEFSTLILKLMRLLMKNLGRTIH